MELHLLENRMTGGKVSFGSCWGRGEVREACFTLKNADGTEIPVQSRAAAYWPDGSIKWARHTALSDKMTERVLLEPAEKENEIADGIQVTEDGTGWQVDAGKVQMRIPGPGSDVLAEKVCLNGREKILSLTPVYLAEERSADGEDYTARVRKTESRVDRVSFEEQGDVFLSVLFEGYYMAEEEKMPFQIRMQLTRGSDRIHFVNTFFFHGDEQKDRMKGLGIRAVFRMEDENYNRHIRIPYDGIMCHEPAMILESRIPRTGPEMKMTQFSDEMVRVPEDEEKRKKMEAAIPELPLWNEFSVWQVNDESCLLSKKTKDGCCDVPILLGKHADGAVCVTGENGGITAGIRDFWQRYPSEICVRGAGQSESECTLWFWSPKAESMDFRHYDTRSFESNYEGFPWFGASPEGIAATSECDFLLTDRYQKDEDVLRFARSVQKPAVYLADPEVYHAREAFGPWSLPTGETEEEKLMERDLDTAITFYQEQIRQNHWYGFFNYGDWMHSYDAKRHSWKYDIGGWAWDNTELVPTYWLWAMFMRSGREDVLTLAESMSRHASEIDTYHFGPLQGQGSRHNVRHWGCPCKEPRVAMAGHHRPMYYLLGDLRVGECMDEVKNAAETWGNTRYVTDMLKENRARTGPDWSSFVSDWMTAYERTLEPKWRELVKRGMEDIAKAPMRLGSGPAFRFDPKTGSMEYIGERTGNIHLTLCFAAFQILYETAEAMDLPELRELLAEYGDIYVMDKDERNAKYGDLVKDKGYVMSYIAGGIGSFAGEVTRRPELKKRAWRALMLASPERNNPDGFASETYAVTADGREMKEIPWSSTNYIAQWCQNVIMALEFARDELPGMDEIDEIVHSDYHLDL